MKYNASVRQSVLNSYNRDNRSEMGTRTMYDTVFQQRHEYGDRVNCYIYAEE